MLAKKALLSRLEGAIHALSAAEAASDAAADAAGDAAADLDAQVQVCARAVHGHVSTSASNTVAPSQAPLERLCLPGSICVHCSAAGTAQTTSSGCGKE